MFKWRSPVEINSHVWKSAFWREHTGNRLNWRQAPIARVLCVLCLLLLKLTAWIENAARAAPSGVCLRPHHLRVGREADQRILRCNRRTYRGSPIHAWLRCYQHRWRPKFLELRHRQEPAHQSVAPYIKVQVQDTFGQHPRKVRRQEQVCALSDRYCPQISCKILTFWIPVQWQVSACPDGFGERIGRPRSRLINVRRM